MLLLTSVVKCKECTVVHTWANFTSVDRYDNNNASDIFQLSKSPSPWLPKKLNGDEGCVVVLLCCHHCCFCDWACTVIEWFEFTIIIELVGLSLFIYDSMCSNYISDCCVDITFVGSAVIICKDFSSEWCAHGHFLSLKVDPFLHLPSWTSPACSAHHGLSTLHF